MGQKKWRWHEEKYFLFGASGAFGFNDSAPGNQTTLIGGDFLLKWKPKAYRSFTWQTEYLFRNQELPGLTAKDGGFYSYVDYQFVKRWHAGLRYDFTGLPQDSIAKEWRLTPAITFDPTEFSRLKLQYAVDKITGLNPVHVALLQLEFSVGPHGAHA